jgi:hypothetical protein
VDDYDDGPGGFGLNGVLAIHTAFGRKATEAAELDQTARRLRLMGELHQVPLNPPVLVPVGSTSGTLQLADLLSPKTGFHWSLRRLSAWGFTAGTVTVFKNANGGEIVFVFPSAGTYTFGRGEILLEPNAQLVFSASGVTLAANSVGLQVGGAADCMPSWLLPDYLI